MNSEHQQAMRKSIDEWSLPKNPGCFACNLSV